MTRATTEELEKAWNTPWPAEVADLQARANALRMQGEHVGAGDLERDAAALIRRARAKALEQLIRARR